MLRNIGSNWALAVVQILVLIQLTPVQITALGAPMQGAWLTIASLTSILGLLILGVPMASVRFLAVHVARREIDLVNEAIATCLGICLGLGAAAVLVGAGLYVFFEHTYLHSPAWQPLGPEILRQARMAYWIVVAQVGLGFAAQIPFGVLDAHHAFVARNSVKIAGLVLRVALIVGVLRLHASLVVLALVQGAVMVLELVVAVGLIRRFWPEVRFGLRGFDRARMREILGFSLFAMLLNMGSQLAFQSDQLVINAYGSPEQGTLFDVGNKFFPPLVGLVLGIGMVIMPMATKLQATGQMEELRHLFLKWSKIAYSIALLAGAFLLVLGPEFVAWWMGPAFAAPSGRVVRVLMLAFLIFLPVRGVASPMLMGLGKPVLTSIAFVVMGAVNLGLSLVLMKPLGILGVAIGTAIPCALFAVTVATLACREIGVPLSTYAGYVIGRPTLGALVPILFLVSLKRGAHAFPVMAPRWVVFIPLFAAGLGMTALFAAVWILFVYRDDPYFDLAGKAERFLPGILRRKAP